MVATEEGRDRGMPLIDPPEPRSRNRERPLRYESSRSENREDRLVTPVGGLDETLGDEDDVEDLRGNVDEENEGRRSLSE